MTELLVDNSYSIMYGNGVGGVLCTEEQLGAKTFYTETLGWSEDVWSFSNLDADDGKYPMLK